MVRDGAVVLDTSRQVFPALTGKQWYRTVGFKEIAIVHGVLDESYRHTAQFINRIRHQPGATAVTTLQDAVESEGSRASKVQAEQAGRIVREQGLDEQTLQPMGEHTPVTAERLPSEAVDCVLRELAPDEPTLQAMRANPVAYENPSAAVHVSIDDVLAKKQKEHREHKSSRVSESVGFENGELARSTTRSDEQAKKCVHTTVAHVETGAGRRIFASAGLLSTCLLVMAFVVANKKLQSTWMFFVDGQRSLQDLLLRVFGWQGTVQLILDWFHLVKKCKEQLSLALKGRHIRNEQLRPLLRMLWLGQVDAAICALRGIDPKQVKAPDALDRLVGYFERNRAFIPCYAARKKLGLRNSSNRGEKANDVIVSARQKNNGMSWSQSGSSALSTLQALVCNDNHRQWFDQGTVDFQLAA